MPDERSFNADVADDAFVANQAQRLLADARRSRESRGRRFILGIAGIGGSGKSTLADRLCEAIDARSPGRACVLPLDGFHLTNRQLRETGRLSHKGAPDTFDAAGVADLLEAAADGDATPAFPVYDREQHEPVWRPEQKVRATVDVLIVEGLYVLAEAPPGVRVSRLLDERWWLAIPMWCARQWILQRHVRGGRDMADAKAHYERVDKPNAEWITAHLGAVDRVVTWPAGTLPCDSGDHGAG